MDLTGSWASIVTEDWRWRMLTPPKGDFASLPLNDEGRNKGNQWTTSQDGSCEAYGAAGLMRMPTRLNIGWEGDDVLKIETDAGKQTRRFYFDGRPPANPLTTLQGHSVAEWIYPGGSRQNGSLKVTTSRLSGGWLRKNGAPYSEKTALTEFFDTFSAPDGRAWFVITTIVEDPTYLTQPFLTSTHFRREPNGAQWRPEECKYPAAPQGARGAR